MTEMLKSEGMEEKEEAERGEEVAIFVEFGDDSDY